MTSALLRRSLDVIASTVVVCLFMVWGQVTAQDTAATGSLSGVATTSDGTPASGVVLCLQTTNRCATTDDIGRFAIPDVRAGEFSLEVTAPGLPPYPAATVQIRAGLDATIEVTLPLVEGVRQEVTVTPSAFAVPAEVKTSGFLVQRSEILQSASALQDVSRYLQTLPGVAIGSDDFRNDIIVRGGSPLENLFVVDNVEIPNINSFATFASAGGTVSVLDAELIQNATFLTGGFPAPYGNRTSSVLQVSQREGSRQGFEARATVGFAGAGAILEGPVNNGKGSWVASVRRSFLDVFTRDAGFGGVPVLYTLNGKVVYDLTPRDRVWAVNLGGVDNIRLGPTEGDTRTDEVFNFDIRYTGWRNGTGVNWQHLFSRGVGLLGVSHSEAHIDEQVKDLVRNGVPGAGTPVDTIIAASPVVFRENSREAETTIKYDLTTPVPVLGRLQVGGSVKRLGVNYDTASPFGNDSPYSAVPGLDPFSLKTKVASYQSGAYAQATQDLGRRVSLTWGGRFDNYQYIDESRFSPRAGVNVKLTDRLSWKGATGIYYEQPFFLFLAAFPENRQLLPFRADHFVTGISYEASPTARLTVEAYRKNYRDYPVATEIPSLSLASIGDTFNIRDILFPLTAAGRGRADGLELSAEKKFSDTWYGQANIAFSRSTQAGLDGVQRPGSFDYPVVLNVSGGYKVNARWSLSTRMSYLAGRPYTPFDLEESAAQRRGVYDLTQVNAVRLPDYFRFDVRVDRRFIVGGRSLLVFAGAQNITNRLNVAGYTWNRGTNRVDVNEQLGIFPVAGLEWRF
ncbi:MAG: TonB-dependent receptor [Acidobacteria bacterium]|nr:TonB-dependent receptor [Acidobacteriota bacterium]